MRRARILLSSLVIPLALPLAGCGQKGPLFIPGVPKDSTWPYPPSPPAPPPSGTPAPPPTQQVPDLPPSNDDERKK
jgi:hypothetical protein